MEKINFFFVVIGLVFITLQCKDNNDEIHNLPELPTALAEKLELSLTAPVLTNVPQNWTPPESPAKPVPAALERALSCNSQYRVPVIYPVTICFPIYEFPVDDFPIKMADHPLSAGMQEQDSLIQKRELAFYKLRSFKNKPLSPLYYCTVVAGPWIAEIEEYESCDHSISNTYRFIFDYPPNPFEYTWQAFGLDPIPLPEDMQVTGEISKVGEFCSCCGGRFMCHGICLPFGQDCRDQIPVGR